MDAFRSNLGRSILLGLEFLVAADIINTVAIEPTLESLAVLAGIVPRASGAQVILTRRTETCARTVARSDSPAAAPSPTTATHWRQHCARARKKSPWLRARCRRWAISIPS